jgi:hypothetical protein
MSRLNEKKVEDVVNGGTLRASLKALGLTIVAVVEFGIGGPWITSAALIDRLPLSNKCFVAYCYC